MRLLSSRWLRRMLSWRRFVLCTAPLSIIALMTSGVLLQIWTKNHTTLAEVSKKHVFKDAYGNVIQVHGNLIELAKDYGEMSKKAAHKRLYSHSTRRKKRRKSQLKSSKVHSTTMPRDNKKIVLPKRTLQNSEGSRDTREPIEFPSLNEVFSESERAKATGTGLCGKRWQKEYVNLHKRILSGKAPRKFLVYSCKGEGYGCAGYGNRLGGITTLFLLAVLTKRAFLIDWDYSQPLALRNFFRPAKIKWDYSIANLDGLSSRTHYWGKGFPKNLHNTSVERPGNLYPEFYYWFKKIDLEKYFEFPVERITAVWNFAHAIWANPFLEEKAAEVGLVLPNPRYSMVGCVYDLLFRTTPEFENRLNYARELIDRRGNSPVIGLHVRMGDSAFGRRNKYNTQDFKSFFSCAHSVQRRICAEYPLINASDIRWFLATDSSAVKGYARREFPGKVVTLDMVPEHIGIFQRQRQPSVEGMYGVLLDHFLLSECHYLILSSSSFGTTALGRTYHAPGSYTYGEKCGAPVSGR
ncbi:uncharacterized protein LOC116615582 [Nematostella vectensis]|uniref:uncharacterized protein LOC116615582 n=1 Tax=Nematostella vectensis TaxID=45351 RepID=UPI0020779956|nr:uncharacterized protein LOC116615582 [Nematostella vectensis]XP_032233196.2 uncharacterized protein LOC116615582 [Nematostella vectensis]XP_032233197.2 uncharacterized protein LOC116615582 [Nematostella vectensis]XP_032233198.2 uncharacterized protein LOC116615582 [Nematostella vectensis]XP_048576950.1 uncharacterized protein LOC116615582 [Nematostella vectensis]XP_048576952.1 uncharacterized protein LOC116615582 [Nematostella vectensis]